MPTPGRIRKFNSFESSQRILERLPQVNCCKKYDPRDDVRPTTKTRGYGRKWNTYRRWYLSQHPFCVRCGRLAHVVDHIKAIRYGGSKTDPQNHQSLCRECHAAKSVTEEAEAKAKGWVPLWGE